MNQLNSIHNDFIGVYPNLFTPEYCAKCIEWFDNYSKIYPLTERENNMDYTRDSAIVLDSNILIEQFKYAIYHQVLPDYYKKHPILKTIANIDELTITDYKIQKTLPGEGFMGWHCENNGSFSPESQHRHLVYTLYLNDIEDGGETEFLYQKQRLSPQTGLLCIFPAYYTHTHRGNPPLKKIKYIMTGWLETLPRSN